MIKFSSFVAEASTSDLLPQKVIISIKASGGKIYQIGGAVRDELLYKVSKDLDILVVGLEMTKLAKTLEEFGKTNMVGKSFGIIKFVPEGETEEIDISVPRVDEKSTGKGHKDFVVKLGGDITLQQDQLRRDFWMNAIAKDIDTGKLWDMDGKGLTDIQKKQVRMISPTAFEDDPLRMLRAVQFASRFSFTIESETLKEIQKNARTITTVSADRFQEEFRKMYDKSDKPSIGVNLLYTTHLMKHIFSKAVGVATMIDNIPKGNFPTFLAIMIGHAYGNQTKSILQKVMRLSNKDANAAQDVINWATLGRTTDKIKVVEFVDRLSPDGQKSIDAFEVARMGKTLTDILKRYPVKSLKDLAITGRDLLPLKIKGKMIGTTLQYALKIALNSGKNDKKFLLRAIKKHILSEGRYLVEEIKYESILKYVVKPSELRKLLQLQKKISDPEMVPLKSQDLHITLINSPEYKQMRKQLKQDDLPDPDFRIDFEEPQRIEGANGRVSYYAKVKQQRELKSYVKTNVGHVEDHRIYHVSLANKTGNKGDSVAYV
jgi:tRNA nucleotidyltransferase/poly(A) polymerase